MRQQYPRTYLFSADVANATAVNNAKAYIDTKAYLKAKGLAYKIVTGCYKGKTENSFALIDTASEVESIVRALCLENKQESYLVLDSDRNADLVFLDGSATQRLGQFHSTESSVALERDAYTYDKATGAYYVCD